MPAAPVTDSMPSHSRVSIRVPWNLVSACRMNLTSVSGLGDARTFILADLAAAGAAAIAAAAYLLM